MWNQVYNPLGNAASSTIAAALPVVTLLVLIASNKVKAHIAAVIALIVANLVAVFIFTMPAGLSLRATSPPCVPVRSRAWLYRAARRR